MLALFVTFCLAGCIWEVRKSRNLNRMKRESNGKMLFRTTVFYACGGHFKGEVKTCSRYQSLNPVLLQEETKPKPTGYLFQFLYGWKPLSILKLIYHIPFTQ